MRQDGCTAARQGKAKEEDEGRVRHLTAPPLPPSGPSPTGRTEGTSVVVGGRNARVFSSSTWFSRVSFRYVHTAAPPRQCQPLPSPGFKNVNSTSSGRYCTSYNNGGTTSGSAFSSGHRNGCFNHCKSKSAWNGIVSLGSWKDCRCCKAAASSSANSNTWRSYTFTYCT